MSPHIAVLYWCTHLSYSLTVSLLSFYFSPPPKQEKLDSYIFMIHNKFLKKICDESDLKGLVYHGGPKVVCRQCEWRGVLTCVGYPDEIEYSAEVNCKECNEQYNIEELLRLQVSQNNLCGSPSYKPNIIPLHILILLPHLKHCSAELTLKLWLGLICPV